MTHFPCHWHAHKVGKMVKFRANKKIWKFVFLSFICNSYQFTTNWMETVDASLERPKKMVLHMTWIHTIYFQFCIMVIGALRHKVLTNATWHCLTFETIVPISTLTYIFAYYCCKCTRFLVCNMTNKLKWGWLFNRWLVVINVFNVIISVYLLHYTLWLFSHDFSCHNCNSTFIFL